MRNKLLWKLLGAYIPLILVAVIVLNFFVSFSLRHHFEDGLTEKLYGNSLLVESFLEKDIATKNLQAIQQKTIAISKQLNLRITVIAFDGTVLGDSEHNPTLMENHSDRPEVRNALAHGTGEVKRFSDTLQYTMKYFAVSMHAQDKPTGVIRFAIALKEVDQQIRVLYRAVLLGGIVAALLMILVGYFISRSITNPIREMEKIAHLISKGDFSQKISVQGTGELGSLAHSLNRMAEKLQTQIESLKRMDKVRTDFVANVSHELKTPLTSIKGYVETLQDGALEDTENAEKFLQIINKHADSLTLIVDDLLTLSDLETSTSRLHKQTFDLHALLEEISLGFGHAFREKKINIEIQAHAETFSITADKEKINQVFVNIIDNAVKYSEKGKKITLTVTKDTHAIVVAVQDQGIGIPEKYIPRVFERFYRVDKARSREAGGTGLGLAIVKHIVSLHAGTIHVVSRENQGTSVTVTLPIA